MKTYGLIGRSLGHSFSKSFFSKKFFDEGVNAEYNNFELQEIDEVKNLFGQELSGLNVTIPYKESILPFLDEVSEEAAKIGAVTDAYGFQNSIKPFMTFEHERALIIGTGGASKAVAYVLKNLGVDVLYISRTPEAENQFSYEEINHHMLNACKLIVHTTPVGTHPDIESSIPFPFEHLTPSHLVVDLIYNPEKTKFLKMAEENGAMILNGQSMLEHQALKAWEIWNQ